jgi:membrane protein DedA with SNARE-associated domain
MPFAGFLIAEQSFTWTGVVVASTLGSIVGSLLSYWIGQYGGGPFVRRYGRYFLLNAEDLKKTEEFFQRHGEITIFISRFIPVVRHLISLPAGAANMNLARFSLYTIVGAGMWNLFLTVVGFYLKQNWASVMKYSHAVDIVVLVGLLIGAGIFVSRHLRNSAAH